MSDGKVSTQVTEDNHETLVTFDKTIAAAIDKALDDGARSSQINGDLLVWACMAAMRCGRTLEEVASVLPQAWEAAQKSIAGQPSA